ncbi:hypothetical protein [Streptomyces hypolithicus]
MAAAHPEASADPELRHVSRLGLVVWFVAQWVLIPVELIARTAWLLALLLGNGDEDMALRPLDAPARFLSPSKLMLRMSHNPARHEAHLDREFARLSLEMEQQQFGWRTKIYHYVGHVGMPDGGYLKGVGLHSREFRGTPLTALTRIAHKHHLVLEAPKNLRRGVGLRPDQGKSL